MFKIYAAEMDYDREASEVLRKELIQIRNDEMAKDFPGHVVVLSHVIAWMDVAMNEMDKKCP